MLRKSVRLKPESVRERNILLVLEYDGAEFYGFQKQPHHPTIQEALESALSRFFNCPMKIQAASGRTDTGVHAEYQAVNFKTTHQASIAQIQKALNGILPASIAVKKIKEVDLDFHARYHAKSKTYEYRIWNQAVRSPLLRRRVWHIPGKLDLKKMRFAAKFFIGRRDFRAFCGAGSKALEKGTVRRMLSIRILNEGPLIRLLFKAEGFLYHMVRNMTGALVDVGRGKIAPNEIQSILKGRDRTKAAATAPAQALSLINVTY